MATDNAQGSSVTFATSGYTAQLLGFNVNDITAAVRDTTNLGTTGARTKKAGKLTDYGTLSLRVQFDPDDIPTIGGTAEHITLFFPIPDGKAGGASLGGTGFATSFSVDGTTGDEGEMEADLEITWDGVTGPNWSASSVSA